MANGVGIAQGLLHGLNIYDQMQQRAIERRLQQQQTAPVDILPLLPQGARQQLYRGAESLQVPRDLAGAFYGNIMRTYQPPTARLEEPTPTFDPAMLPDLQRGFVENDWSAFAQGGRWAGTRIPYSALGSLSLTPGRVINAVGAHRDQDILDQPIGEDIASQITKATGTPVNPNVTPRALKTVFNDDWVDQFINLAAAPVDRASTEASTALTGARTEEQILANELTKRFADQERRAALQSTLLQNARDQIGVELDQAQLDQFLQLVEPTVAQAVANARQAGLDARFTEETFDTAVAQAQQALQNLATQGQLDQATLDRYTQLTPLLVQQYQEESTLRQLQTQRQQLENQLLEEFGRDERRAELNQRLLENARTQVGIEMDEAELDRFNQLTGPVVAKAVTDAAQAQVDLSFSQETFDAMVAQVNQELENLRTQGKLDEAEYERYTLLTPIAVAQAQEELTGLILSNEMQRLENQAAVQTFQNRIQNAQLQTQMLDLQLQQAQVALDQARQNLVMARRLGPVQEQQAQLEVQRLQEQIQTMRVERQQLEQQSRIFGDLSPDDQNFAFKMYEAETEVYRDAGMWVPSYLDYAANLTSQQPMDWNQYVTQYDQEMRQILGDPPTDRSSFPWLESRWQTAYRNAYDRFSQRYSTWDFERQAFPPIEVWYANQTSENPLPEPELVERWNANDPTLMDELRGIVRGSSTSTPTAFDAASEAEGFRSEYGNRALEVLNENEELLLDNGYTKEQIEQIRQLLRGPVAPTTAGPGSGGGVSLNIPGREQIIDSVGAALNAPGDLLLAPFGGRASRDPAVAEDNVRRGVLGATLLSALLGARAMSGGPRATGGAAQGEFTLSGPPALRSGGARGQFRGPIETPTVPTAPVGEVPAPSFQLPFPSSVATQQGESALRFLANRFLMNNGGNVSAAVTQIEQGAPVLQAAGFNIQRLIELVRQAGM